MSAFVLIPVLALLTLSAWAFSSPVGSSPDDDFHLTSIWCGAGTNAECTLSGDKSAIVPRDLLDKSLCYAMQSKISAGCQGPNFGTHPENVVTTQRGNFEASYPPVYYFVMHVFAGPNIDISVLAMRIANSIIFVGFFTGLYFLLPRHRRSTLIVSLVVTAVPLGLFLIASINPSGWGILSAGGVLLSVLGFFETTGRQRIGLAAMAVLATVIGAGARADAAAYAVIAIGAAAIISFKPTKKFLLSLALPLVLVAISVVFYLTSSQSNAAASGLVDATGIKIDTRALLASVILNISDLWIGVFGHWNLGWLDTGLPAIVWVPAWGLFVAVMFAGLALKETRKSLVFALMFAALWFIPAYLQYQTRAPVGSSVQARYILPLIVMLATVSLLRRRGTTFIPARAQLVMFFGILSVAQTVSLHANIRRYVTGNVSASWNLNSHAEWWWNIPVSPNMVWAIGTIAFSGMLAVMCAFMWNAESLAVTTATAQPVDRNLLS